MSPSATTTAAPAPNGNGAIKVKNGVNGSVNGSANGTHANGNGVVKNGKNGKEAHLSSTELIRLENEHGAHNYHPLPVVFDRALGAKVWDPEGREYIDMLSAYSAVNQGHCHPRIVAALIAQAQKLTLSSRAFHNSVFGRFAERVGGVFGWEMVLPMNTGAEAVESALKLARKWAYLRKGVPEGEAIVLSVADNFHGRTLGVISMSTDPSARVGFGPYLPGVGPTFVDPEAEGGSRLIRFGEIRDLERALELHGPRVAAFLVEPVQGEAGIIVPPPTYLPAVAALCKKHNVLLICDEIQTGLGRTGKMLAIDHAGIRPDIVLLGKALSGGVYPVSAVLADKDVMLCIQPGEHGSTYGGNPLACAVAITALDVLVEEDLSARAARLGEVFRSSVLALKSPYIKTVRGLGLLNAVVIDEDACNAARAARGQDVAGNKRRTAWQFCLLLKARGVLAKTTHGNVVRFAPPLVIEEADLVKAVKIIGECLVDLERLDEIPGDDSEEGGH
ncbi:ornithine-oxo-acid aminotransferase [Mycena albidolilacea]|uniref:ornithine aminotransferase n=1 Tax=Mycena albidolilacea TaxID=1033008 RepID=A0AAD6Z3Z6_9AGAR|nr:ornithine-oxo-acid aminotransferase [Mycena albidolilacea]